MEILQVIVFGLIGSLIITVVKMYGGYSGAIGDIIRLTIVVSLMIFIVSQLGNVFYVIRELANKMQMEDTYLEIVFKIIGIAYIAEFGAQLCEDAGEKAISSKIQLVGKVMIFVMASPVVLALIDLITDLL